MRIYDSITLTTRAACAYGAAYEFLHQPENFPKWASGLSTSLRRDGGRWIAQTPTGEAEIHFSPRNDYGVLDHHVLIAPNLSVDVPMRVIPNGDGCEISLTLLKVDGMTREKFAQDADWVRKDLETLKGVLESLKVDAR